MRFHAPLILAGTVALLAACNSDSKPNPGLGGPHGDGGPSGSGGTQGSGGTPGRGSGGSTTDGGVPSTQDGGTEPSDGGVDSGTVPTPVGLTVNIVNARLGGNVTVTGPGGFSKHVTATTTFTGLTPGKYSVRSLDVSPGLDKGAATKANPARASVDVVANGKQSVTIDYSVPGLSVTLSAGTFPGGLWFTEGSKVVGLESGLPNGDFNADSTFDLSQLATTPTEPPGSAPPLQVQTPTAIAFDALGGVWLADSVHQVIERLGVGAAVTGTLGVLDLTQYKISPYALALDKGGNLWVAGQSTANEVTTNATLLAFGADELLTFTAATPPYAYSNLGLDYDGNPEQMEFDAAGLLWMTLPEATGIGVLAPTLHTSGSANPTVLLGKSLNTAFPKNGNPDPRGLAFDVNKNLWVANRAANEVVGYKPSTLGIANTSPPPDFEIALPTPSVNGTTAPLRLSMVPCTGDIYVVTGTLGDEHVYTYDISDPTQPALKTSITSPDIGNWLALVGFATNPIPAGMPLATNCGGIASP